MSLKIDINHPIFLLKNKIHEISKEFLEPFGFGYFQYLRCFDDGSISCLTNDTRLFEYMQQVNDQPVVYSSYENEQEQEHSYWFFWDEALPNMPVQLAREMCQLYNGLTLVRRHKKYYDMIAVALLVEHPNPNSFYLNKLKIIEQFIFNFELQHPDLVQMLNKHPIALPKQYRDINYQSICLPQGRLLIRGKSNQTYITAQELSCLRLILQGATHKQAAQCLNLSWRTIETYLQRVKQRTGFSSWRDIERILVT
ncbi:MAG: LuxR C-terminal-related transcriptional regulator [Tatlockia sp.]|jgi:DNA-binding CsgD family transcriptional regulator